MSYYANFQKHGEAIFRLDTRVYLQNEASPSPNDLCVAAIVGKNPGSARPTEFDCLTRLSLRGDKLLPSVRNRFISAYARAGKAIPGNSTTSYHLVRVWRRRREFGRAQGEVQTDGHPSRFSVLLR